MTSWWTSFLVGFVKMLCPRRICSKREHAPTYSNHLLHGQGAQRGEDCGGGVEFAETTSSGNIANTTAVVVNDVLVTVMMMIATGALLCRATHSDSISALVHLVLAVTDPAILVAIKLFFQ